MATPRILVTGASGFVGRHCLAPLLAGGGEVHALSRAAPPPDLLLPGLTWHRVDLLTAPEAVAALLARLRPSHLLHLAWYAEPGKFWQSPENQRWQAASLELLRQFVAHGGQRAVVAGTVAEYRWDSGYLDDEGGSVLAPATLYGQAKLALAQTLAADAQVAGWQLAWGRLFWLYGPHEHPARLVSGVTRALLRGQHAPCSHGRQQRDFLHVADVGTAFSALVYSGVVGPVNIASGEATPVGELLRRLGELTGASAQLGWGELPLAASEPAVLAGVTRRLRAEVGWQPRHTLASGLADTVAWWRQHGV